MSRRVAVCSPLFPDISNNSPQLHATWTRHKQHDPTPLPAALVSRGYWRSLPVSAPRMAPISSPGRAGKEPQKLAALSGPGLAAKLARFCIQCRPLGGRGYGDNRKCVRTATMWLAHAVARECSLRGQHSTLNYRWRHSNVSRVVLPWLQKRLAEPRC